MAKKPLLGIPEWSSLATGFLFGAFFYTIYSTTSFLTEFVPWRFHWYLNSELSIPLYPEWAPVYLSLNLLLALCPFVLRRFQDMAPLFFVMVVQTLVAGLCFLWMPIELSFPPHPSEGLLGLAETINLEHNNMPSLHVTYAITAALVLGARAPFWGRVLFHLWAWAITAATVLTHQHHLIDVAAGLLLAWSTVRWIYRPLHDAQALEAVQWPQFGQLLTTAFRFFRGGSEH